MVRDCREADQAACSGSCRALSRTRSAVTNLEASRQRQEGCLDWCEGEVEFSDGWSWKVVTHSLGTPLTSSPVQGDTWEPVTGQEGSSSSAS